MRQTATDPISSLTYQSDGLRAQHYSRQKHWRFKKIFRRLLTSFKIDDAAWQQQAQSLFGQKLFDYLDNNLSVDNLLTVAYELHEFRDLLDLRFRIFTWKELKKRSLNANDPQKRIGVLKVLIESNIVLLEDQWVEH